MKHLLHCIAFTASIVLTAKAQNVGVGTSLPVEKFQIGDRLTFHDGGWKTIGYNYTFNSSADRRLIADEVAAITYTDGGDIRLRTAINGAANSSISWIDGITLLNNGNVGIGTTSPTRKFEVNNLMKFTNSSADVNDGVIGTAPFAEGLNIVGINTDATGRKISFWGSFIQNENPTANSFIGNTNFPSGIWNSSGNVGIGTTSVGQRLEVNGNVRAAGQFISTTADQARFIQGNYGLIHRQDGANYYFLSTASGDQYGGWNGLRPFRLEMASGNVYLGADILTVNHGGNVGINNTSPGYRFDVAGKARLRVAGFMDNANTGQLEISNAASGHAYISFHNEGSWGAHFGLETDGWFSTRGWSPGASGFNNMRVGTLQAQNYNIAYCITCKNRSNGGNPGDNTGNAPSRCAGFGSWTGWSAQANGNNYEDYCAILLYKWY